MIDAVSSALHYIDAIDKGGTCARLEKMIYTIGVIALEVLTIVEIAVFLPFQVIGKTVCEIILACCDSETIQDLYERFPESFCENIAKIIPLALGIIGCLFTALTLAQFTRQNLVFHMDLDIIGKTKSYIRYSDSVEEEAQVDEDPPETPFIAAADLPEPPQGGIIVGLANYGNTCWLNSTLKFIASTSYYDEMLTIPPPRNRVALQDHLRTIVGLVRQGQKVPEPFFKDFLKELKKAIPGMVIGKQHDAPEFLLEITKILRWQPAFLDPEATLEMNKQDLYPRRGMVYEPKEDMPAGLGKYAKLEDFHTHVDVTIPTKDAADKPLLLTALDLATLAGDVGSRPIRPDLLQEGVKNDKQFKFETVHHFVTLPKIIMIYLKRFHSDPNGKKAAKISAPIQLADHQVQFTRYEPEYVKDLKGVDCVDKMTPKETVSYRIGAAIVHSGSTGGGHYTCMERAADGSIIYHSDSTVRKGGSEKDFSGGYFLRLDRVD